MNEHSKGQQTNPTNLLNDDSEGNKLCANGKMSPLVTHSDSTVRSTVNTTVTIAPVCSNRSMDMPAPPARKENRLVVVDKDDMPVIHSNTRNDSDTSIARPAPHHTNTWTTISTQRRESK
jgi:hypothetical protein